MELLDLFFLLVRKINNPICRIQQGAFIFMLSKEISTYNK